MTRVAYVNGAYVPHRAAQISIDDRANYFADAIYEVIYFKEGKFIDLDSRLDRLFYGLSELRINTLWTGPMLTLIMQELTRRNRLDQGIIYIQISRGVAVRDHIFPPANTRPTLLMTVKSMHFYNPPQEIKVITVPDLRWKKCNIKTTNLLANVLVRQAAHEAGAYEGWMVNDQGHITEGAATSAFIVTRNQEVWTYPMGTAILRGCLRRRLIEMAPALGVKIIERPFAVEDAYEAEEAFLSSTTQTLVPVVQINDKIIGTGKAGPITLRLREEYLKMYGMI